MYKQIIIADRDLNMSAGKLAVMASHGSIAFLTGWFRENICTSDQTINGYGIKENARIDCEIYNEWINNSFTKVALEVHGREEMEEIIKKAHEAGMINGKDYFNIVDESTEFLGVPQWAVVAFRPMAAEVIDPITGGLNLYGKSDSSLYDEPLEWGGNE